MVNRKVKMKAKSTIINYDFLGVLSSCLTEYIKGKLTAIEIIVLLKSKLPATEQLRGYESRDDFEGYELIETFLEVEGLTQIQLAEKIEVPPSKLKYLIKGRVKISPSIARKLAKVLGVKHTLFL